MIFENSRYATTAVYQDATTHETWLGTRVPVALTPGDDDDYVTPNAGERPDQFASRVWGNQIGPDSAARLWWVICDLNNIVNPFAFPMTELWVPQVSRVLLEILSNT